MTPSAPRPRLPRLLAAGLLVGSLLARGLTAQVAPAPQERLPLPGEVFEVGGRAAFVIQPPSDRRRTPQPWVWYAPTLPGLPSNAEVWMFERFLAAGVAIAGVDVGESYGSPAGVELYDQLYDELVHGRSFAPQPVLLARSRGGLMLYAWAAAHPRQVAGAAGIYPVCDVRSYPGLERAAKAFGMTPAQLEDALGQHNPVDHRGLAALAAAGVAIHHIHGDADAVVPLDANSAALQRRYRALGGDMTVEVVPGRGHDMWRGWFESRRLVDFVLDRAPARSTSGFSAPGRLAAPAGAEQLVGPAGSVLVPEDDDGPHLWTFREGVLTASPQWDSVVTPGTYQDFRMHLEFATNAVDGGDPETRGNSGVYIQKRYEVQISDAYGVDAEDYKASYCASLYRLKKPDVLACRPPGAWQSFDIVFRAPRWDGEAKVEDARITLWHNGQLAHDDVVMTRKTGAGQPEGPAPGPVKLQGHHNEVRFRNVWIQRLELGGPRAEKQR